MITRRRGSSAENLMIRHSASLFDCSMHGTPILRARRWVPESGGAARYVRVDAPLPIRGKGGDGPGGRFRRASLHECAAGAAINVRLASAFEKVCGTAGETAGCCRQGCCAASRGAGGAGWAGGTGAVCRLGQPGGLGYWQPVRDLATHHPSRLADDHPNPLINMAWVGIGCAAPTSPDSSRIAARSSMRPHQPT
jgi:hypothetical protein